MEKNERGITLSATFTDFGKTIVELTRHLSKDDYWTQANEHLISILGLYVFNIEHNEKGVDTLNYVKLLREAKSFLEENNDWNALSAKLLATSDPQLKAKFQNDALFYQDTDALDWVAEADKTRKDIIIKESLERLQYLYDVVYSLDGTDVSHL